MEIKVTDLDEMQTIFVGDADEFLEINMYDEELELFLNRIERLQFGESKIFEGNLGSKYLVEKECSYL